MSSSFMQMAGWPPLLAVAAENPLQRFGVNAYDLISQAIAFLLVAWILNRFVFRTVRESVEARRREAEEAAANNERIRRELEAAEAARREAVLKANEQAEHLISEARAAAAELLSREQTRCEQLGMELLGKARDEARLEQARLRAELREQIAGLVVGLTASLSRLELRPEDRERLTQAAIRELSAPEKK